MTPYVWRGQRDYAKADKRREEAAEITRNVGALARRILEAIGPDPDAPRHRDDLAIAIGAEHACMTTGCQRRARSMAMCDTHYRAFKRVLDQRMRAAA